MFLKFVDFVNESLNEDKLDNVKNLFGKINFYLNDKNKIIIEGTEGRLSAEKNNDSIFIESLSIKKRNLGLGTKILNELKLYAKNNGFKSITGFAVKSEEENGYYFFAKHGGKLANVKSFKANEYQKKINRILKNRTEKNIEDLMKSKEGSQFWKENGISFPFKINI